MNTERIALVAVTLALVVGGLATLFAPTVASGPGGAPGQAAVTTAVADAGLGSLFSVALWGVTLLFGATALV
ncbi:hypothetical protein C464_05965 [Halorubrum coriense DSM 10284]|uniref:Uncharacterized protein n=1 Tax=Halorubrum coriense DSM 10284 TaxID=1227466 RepID=M0EPC4_9EURY|nr:hypothetical protein [Halorubrum coriense]ELZ48933.1 hypothetical protein C464_05965 [Halorubrum coriense DSM 10284]